MNNIKAKTEQSTLIELKQDSFLTTLVQKKLQVNVYLISGIKLQGYINGFDNHVIFLTHTDNQENTIIQMIYKQAISTILLLAD